MTTISTSTTLTTAYICSPDTTGKLVLQTGATPTTALTIDTSQNVGIGTSSPSRKLVVSYSGAQGFEFGAGVGPSSGNELLNYNRSTSAYIPVTHYASTHTFTAGTAGATRALDIDSSGNVGIGTSSPAVPMDVNGRIRTRSGTNFLDLYHNGTLAYVETTGGASTPLGFATAGVERARFDTSGNLLVGTTTSSFTSGAGFKLNASTSGQQQMCIVVDTATGGHGTYHVYNLNATNNGFRFYVATNGGIYNYSGNNSNLSDERTKTNIELAGGYLEKICAIPVKLFNYKDETEGEQRTLGVIAQDVEAVAPELVNNAGFGETPDGEDPLKSIYTTDMQFALMKCIQEQQAIIQSLTQRIETLEAK